MCTQHSKREARHSNRRQRDLAHTRCVYGLLQIRSLFGVNMAYYEVGALAIVLVLFSPYMTGYYRDAEV